jgi:hypothetical protein
MRSHHVHYQLEHGFIQNWLVAGPQTIPVKPEQFLVENFRQQIAHKYYEPASGITQTPVERGPLTKGLFRVGDYAGSWNYFACREDHQVDHSGVYSQPHYLRSWAYTLIASKTAVEVSLVLTTHGPADVWLNGQHVHRQEHFLAQQPGSVPFKVLLVEGMNKILVRFENVAIRECAHAMAMQVCRSTDISPDQLEPYPSDADLHICIPTLIQGLSRRNTFENVYSTTYIKQDVFEGEEPIYLHWPDEIERDSPAVIRLMTASGKIYGEATVDGTAGDKAFLGYPHSIPEGPYRLFIMPLAWEYYERDLRITRELNLWSLGRNRYSAVPYGTFAKRLQEVLTVAAGHTGLFAEIAKMALNLWEAIETEVILQAAQQASPLELLGILGMLYRFSAKEEFPKELVQPLEDCILGFHYGDEEVPSFEAGSSEGCSEGQRILSLACEILAGQRYPEHQLSHSGKSGQWHRENGERLAVEWLQQRGTSGFADWDSSTSFADDLTALSHLVDLAETEQVWEMASVVMDKIFFTIAINSYQGVLGSTHGRTCAPIVKGGLLEPASGITRLMWGTGIFNQHIAGPVSLACMEKYELPSIIPDIAVSNPEEMWSRERHAVNAERFVNKVTYKTPDSMLCSAQDYYPGEKGCQEHIWQATLGAAATVFVTHPACSSENDTRQPNFWAGNAVMPRVAQWKDTLIAVYHLPEDDWMGFTHAYFPTYAFDEYILREGWAFARKGNGYLALTTAQGFDFIQRGQYAFRELRSYGLRNTWLCQMGRAVLDGDFNTFQEKVLGLTVKFEEQSVDCTTLRGEALSFGWQGPFLRNGQEQSLSEFMHYENPYTLAKYPCTQMEIQHGEDLLRLDFRRDAG